MRRCTCCQHRGTTLEAPIDMYLGCKELSHKLGVTEQAIVDGSALLDSTHAHTMMYDSSLDE